MRSKKEIWIGLAIMLISVFIAGCGPSPEEQTATAVALTAAAATNTPTITPTSTYTPTPTPTYTPTPIPYYLSVLVTGEEDAPVGGAIVIIAEVEGDAGEQTTDDTGRVFWTDLPGESINLSISAQGYFPTETSETIKRGDNPLTIVLERDPHGLLPSQACAPGERLLYLDDFQDGEAQGWTEIEYRAQEWDIVSNPDNPGDMVIARHTTYEGSANLWDRSFDNAVWRLELMHSGISATHIAWHWHDEGYETEEGRVEWSAYPVWIHFPDIHVNRVVRPFSDIALRWTPYVLRVGVWHQIEISTYEGRYEFWIDGIPWVQYDDPEPLPEGRIVIGTGLGHTPDSTAFVYFDDFVVCELTAPFIPMPTPESEQ